MPEDNQRPVVVIVGGGFAGLECARALKRAPVDVVLVDRSNHHLFQPLLYQVATAALSPANIAAPIRRIMRRQRNCTVVMGEVESVDAESKVITIDGRERAYDYLVLACGMQHNYFGHDEWEAVAPGLKSIDDALEMRRRVLLAFEAAEVEADEAARQAELTFVVIGAGPTGVELAGAIAEIATQSIPRDFRRVDTTAAKVVLVEGADRVLPAFHPDSSERAQRSLEQLGVEVVLGTMASTIDDKGVTIGQGDDARRIDSRCVLWAAGLKAESVVDGLDVPKDDSGRVEVESDLSAPGHRSVFVVGDLMAYEDPKLGEQVPGVAQGAMQSGRFVGKLIAGELGGKSVEERPAFHYFDKGSMATIGRAHAVAEIGPMRFGGFVAWVLWSVIHVAFLIGFRNRLIALIEWSWLYVSWSRGARLITGRTAQPGPAERADALG